MHLIVAIHEDQPERTLKGSIGKFIEKISSIQYSVPFVSDPWSKVRPREIRLFDFTIPESIEDDVLKELAPYSAGKITKLSKLMDIPFVKGLIENRLGLKSVDMDKHISNNAKSKDKTFKELPVRLAVIGKLEDGYTEDGIELL